MTGNILLIIMLAVALALCALTVIATVKRPSERKGTRAYSVFGRGKGKASEARGNKKVSAAKAKPEQPRYERRPYMTSAGNMNLKYKLKFRFGAIIKSLICGVAFGLFVVGLLLIILKRNAIRLNPFIYVLIGIVSALAAWAVMFFLLNPSFKKIARRIDNDYRLNERTQTALAFERKDGAIISLQREDAGERLTSLPKLKPKFSRIWQYCLIVFIALAISVTGIFIPAAIAEEEELPYEQRPFTLSRTQRIELQQLIQDVNDSGLTAELKTPTVQLLEQLLADLTEAKTMGEMQTLITAADDGVEKILTPVNSYEKIYSALEDIGQTHIAQAVRRGVVIYKSIKFNSYSDVRMFWNDRFGTVSSAISSPLAAFRNQFADDSKLKDEAENVASTVEYVIGASGVDSTDALYTALSNLKDRLKELGSTLPDDLPPNEKGEQSEWQDALDDQIFSSGFSFYEKLTYALEDQTFNFVMDKFIGNKIRLIFGLSIPSDDNPLPPYVWQDSTTGKPSTDDPGGIKPPPFPPPPIFENTDLIYDPVTGSYKSLEELYQLYYGNMLNWLKEAQLTEEQKAIVTAYFENMKDSGN